MSATDTRGILLPILGLAVASAIACSSVAAQEACHAPPLREFLEAQRQRLRYEGVFFPTPEADSLVVVTRSGPMLWLAARWNDFEDGALFALRCNNTVLGVTRPGGINRIVRQPLPDSEINAVAVQITPGRGNGIERREMAIYGMIGGHLTRLFLSATFHRESAIAPDSGFLVKREVMISPRGDSIVVRGTTRVIVPVGDTGSRLGPERALPTERLCWSPIGRVYRRCPFVARKPPG